MLPGDWAAIHSGGWGCCRGLGNMVVSGNGEKCSPVVAGGVLCPRGQHDLKGLVEHGAVLGELEAQALELVALVSAAEADVEAALGEVVG